MGASGYLRLTSSLRGVTTIPYHTCTYLPGAVVQLTASHLRTMAAQDEPQAPHLQRRLLRAVVIRQTQMVVFVDYVCASAMRTVLPYYARSLGAPKAATAYLEALYGIGQVRLVCSFSLVRYALSKVDAFMPSILCQGDLRFASLTWMFIFFSSSITSMVYPIPSRAGR
eukprot:6214466-Pleurochrysis_carterae.AAC.2